MDAVKDAMTPEQMDRWVAFFDVEKALAAMPMQHLLHATLQNPDYQPDDFDYLQNLDWQKPAANAGELFRKMAR